MKLFKRKESKFDIIYKLYLREMFTRAKCILRNTHEAEEVVQEAFLRVFKNIDKIDEVKSSRTKNYVLEITQNIAINRLKTRESEFTSEIFNDLIDDNVWDLSTEDSFFEKFEFQQLEKGVAKLEQAFPDYYTALILFYDEGKSTKEAADTLGISNDSFKKRLQRARQKLREVLENARVEV